ncbi:MAG: hypothetical protein PHR68_01540, partial [Candidatus Gracilibacteria bacterium]|nr:hypothetical protein [Candidatus Gracilibacteria bacterium]
MIENTIEQGNGQTQFNKSIDDIFKTTHKYLANLEGNIGELLKKFHIKSDNYDGKIDDEKTIIQIEKVYHGKILKLKDELKEHKKTMNKQAIVSSLISMTMEARGVAINELSCIAKNKLKGSDLADFEKERNDFVKNNNTKEFQELRKELVDASKNLGNIGEVVINVEEYTLKECNENKNNIIPKIKSELKEYSEDKITNQDLEIKIDDFYKSAVRYGYEKDFKKEIKEYIKISLDKNLKKLENKEINQKEYENNVISIHENSLKFGIEKDFSDEFIKIFERSMTSGVVPIALIMTPKLKAAIPVLPAVIGAGIYIRFIRTLSNERLSLGDKFIESSKEMLEIIGSILPITGTAMAIKDTIMAWSNYKDGKQELGDVIANGVGALLSAGIDIVTIIMIASGVGITGAIPLQVVKEAIKEGAITGVKAITNFILKNSWFAVKTLATNGKTLVTGTRVIEKEIEENGAKTIIKETIKSRGLQHDAVDSIKSVFTAKQLRDSGNKLLFLNKSIGEKYAKMRPKKYAEIMNQGGKNAIGGVESRAIREMNYENSNKSTNDYLAYIDSYKEGLDSYSGSKLIKELDVAKLENFEKLSKEKGKILKFIEKGEYKLESDKKNGIDSFQYERLENELKIKKERLQQIEEQIKETNLKLNKVLDILELRVKLINETGDIKLKNEDNLLGSVFSKKIESLLKSDNVDPSSKSIILKQLWADSIKNKYIKEKWFLEELSEIIKKQDFQANVELIKNLHSKGVNELNILLSGKVIEIIGNTKELTSNDLVNLSKLYDSFPKEIETKKTYITDKIVNNFQKIDDLKGDIPTQVRQQVLHLEFLNKLGMLKENVNNNTNFQEAIKSFIDRHSKDNYHVRGLLNMQEYLKGTDLQMYSNNKITKILGIDVSQNKLERKLQKDGKYLEKINDIEKSKEQGINKINEILNFNKEEILLNSKDIKAFFEANKDILSNPEVAKLLVDKIKNSESESEKVLFGNLLKTLNTNELGKINIDGLDVSGKLALINSGLIKADNKLFSDLENSFKEIKNGNKNETDIYNLILGYEVLKGKGIFKNNKDFEILMNKILTNKDKGNFLGNFNRLLNKLGYSPYFSIKDGFCVKSNEGKNETIKLDIINMTNLKQDMIDVVISNSGALNSKYMDNIGEISNIVYKTNFHNKTTHSENSTYDTILSLNREYDDKISKLKSSDVEKLLGEYKIDGAGFGDRFTKKIIITNRLIGDGKINIAKESLIKDITNIDLDYKAKLSLIENIQNKEIKEELFKVFLNNGIDDRIFTHDLFKKLNFSIDTFDINKVIIEKANDDISKSYLYLESLKAKTMISSESKNELLKIFTETKDDKVKESISGISIINDDSRILDYITKKISDETNPSRAKRFLSKGLSILNKYKNISKIDYNLVNVENLLKLEKLILERFKDSGLRGTDELGDEIKNIINLEEKNLLKGFDLEVSKYDSKNDVIYYKVISTGQEINSNEIKLHFSAMNKIKEIAKNSGNIKAIINESDENEFFNKLGLIQEEIIVLKKAGYNKNSIKNLLTQNEFEAFLKKSMLSLGVGIKGREELNKEKKYPSNYPAEIEIMLKSASPDLLKRAEAEGNLIKVNNDTYGLSETEQVIGGKHVNLKKV